MIWRIKLSIMEILTLRYLKDIQVKMLSKQWEFTEKARI